MADRVGLIGDGPPASRSRRSRLLASTSSGSVLGSPTGPADAFAQVPGVVRPAAGTTVVPVVGGPCIRPGLRRRAAGRARITEADSRTSGRVPSRCTARGGRPEAGPTVRRSLARPGARRARRLPRRPPTGAAVVRGVLGAHRRQRRRAATVERPAGLPSTSSWSSCPSLRVLTGISEASPSVTRRLPQSQLFGLYFPAAAARVRRSGLGANAMARAGLAPRDPAAPPGPPPRGLGAVRRRSSCSSPAMMAAAAASLS